MAKRYSFSRENESDKVWWLDNYDEIGTLVFSFDRKKKYYLFRDYPHKLSVREWMIFNEENEYWKDFFEFDNMEYELEHFEEIMALERDKHIE